MSYVVEELRRRSYMSWEIYVLEDLYPRRSMLEDLDS